MTVAKFWQKISTTGHNIWGHPPCVPGRVGFHCDEAVEEAHKSDEAGWYQHERVEAQPRKVEPNLHAEVVTHGV